MKKNQQQTNGSLSSEGKMYEIDAESSESETDTGRRSTFSISVCVCVCVMVKYHHDYLLKIIELVVQCSGP